MPKGHSDIRRAAGQAEEPQPATRIFQLLHCQPSRFDWTVCYQPNAECMRSAGVSSPHSARDSRHGPLLQSVPIGTTTKADDNSMLCSVRRRLIKGVSLPNRIRSCLYKCQGGETVAPRNLPRHYKPASPPRPLPTGYSQYTYTQLSVPPPSMSLTLAVADNWHAVSDAKKRKQIQDRLAQRV